MHSASMSVEDRKSSPLGSPQAGQSRILAVPALTRRAQKGQQRVVADRFGVIGRHANGESGVEMCPNPHRIGRDG